MHNRTRVLSEVLSLDAWHDPFQTSENSVGVFVEMSFQEGRVGGDNGELPFTFKINVKRALLTITVEDPLQIDRDSIARSIPGVQTELTKIKVAKSLAESSLIGKAKLSPASMHVALSGSTKSKSTVSQEDQLRLVQTIPEIIVTPKPRGRKGYAWEMESSYTPFLSGQPWHPTDAPRLKVSSPSVARALDSAIKVEVNCAFEDLDISEIVAKDRGVLETLRNAITNDVSEAAAIQYLKRLLLEADLEPGRIDNRFANIIIANVLAMPS